MVKRISTLSALVLFMFGCESQNDYSDRDAGLYVNVTTDAAFNMVESEYVSSRADYDLSEIITLPTISDFSMTLYSVVSDVETKLTEWESVDDFEAGSQFAPGDYRIEVNCGTITDEGEGKAYFSGTKSFTIKADETTIVEITASLQNSFVKATVSEDFREYFTAGSLAIKVDGRNDVILSPLSSATPLFIRPGTANLVWTGTRQGGTVEATIVENLEIAAKTGYTLNLDVDASKNQIIVQYDDKIDVVPVELVASDKPVVDLPVVEVIGFESNSTVSFSKAAPVESLRFTIIADGGIKDCKLTLSSATATTLGCDESVSLVSSTVQSLFEMKGLKMRGLDAKREKMAYVEFVDLLANMAVGSYSFSMVVTDDYGRATSPTVLKVNVTE